VALSAFDNKAKPPGDEDLAAVLGNTFSLWNELIDHIRQEYSPLIVEWGFTSKSTGWGLRLKQEKRAVLYMTPCNGYFLASFALGEKAVKAAHEAGLPGTILDAIDGAKKYAEGRGVRLEVRSPIDVLNVKNLAAVKVAN
jgi:hypothetical protein